MQPLLKRQILLKASSFCLLLFSVSSCGYHFPQHVSSEDILSITVPYIQGDPDALLNNELASQLALSGRFHCVQSGGDLTLQVVLLGDANDKIGYRFERDNVAGTKRPNILGVENRRTLISEVTLYDARTGECLFGPTQIKSYSEYDYVDPGSPRDLDTITPSGPQSTIRFSLGQLDTVEGAHDDAGVPLYRSLSQTIVQSVLNRAPEL